MPSSSATANGSTTGPWSPSEAEAVDTSGITDIPMGSIITVVAVLLTHMLSAAVPSMKPPTRAS